MALRLPILVVLGCTDSEVDNYHPTATEDDGLWITSTDLDALNQVGSTSTTIMRLRPQFS